MTVALLRLSVGQPVAGAGERSQVFDILWDRGGEEVAEPGAHYLFRPHIAIHPGHCVVALGEVAAAVEARYLLIGCQARRDRLLKFEAPDALRGLFDEAPVALLALPKPSLPLLQLLGALRNPFFEVLGEPPDLFFCPLAFGDVADDGEHVAFTTLRVVHQPNRTERQFDVDLFTALP